MKPKELPWDSQILKHFKLPMQSLSESQSPSPSPHGFELVQQDVPAIVPLEQSVTVRIKESSGGLIRK